MSLEAFCLHPGVFLGCRLLRAKRILIHGAENAGQWPWLSNFSIPKTHLDCFWKGQFPGAHPLHNTQRTRPGSSLDPYLFTLENSVLSLQHFSHYLLKSILEAGSLPVSQHDMDSYCERADDLWEVETLATHSYLEKLLYPFEALA